jgi:hypothetical protein
LQSHAGDGWPDNKRGHPKDIHLSDVGTGERIEPLTCRLQEVRLYATSTLAALMARVIALMALVGLESSGAPVHEPIHEWPPGDIHSRNSV